MRVLRLKVFRLGPETSNLVPGTLPLCVQHNATITAMVSIHTACLVLLGLRSSYKGSVSNITMDVNAILHEFYKNKKSFGSSTNLFVWTFI